jgi:predicted nucleic acid-binding protein
MRLLRIHSLRAADAIQLAAALEWSGSLPDSSATLVTLDRRLAEAADLEGFTILP